MSTQNPISNAPAIASAAGQGVASNAAPKKFGAIIYLSSNRPLRLPDFFVEFRENWPAIFIEKTGKEPHRALFRVARSDFSLELHHERVPLAMTEPVADSTLHWPNAAAALANNVAFFEVTALPTQQGSLTIACDLTRAVASLLAVTDALAVCWLKGPALNQPKTFIATARETFATGLYPLTLWTAARFDASQHTLSTHGMSQFGVPELVLTDQPDAAPLMVDFLFQSALKQLGSRHPLAAGHMIDGPHGRLNVRAGRSADNGSALLILESRR